VTVLSDNALVASLACKTKKSHDSSCFPGAAVHHGDELSVLSSRCFTRFGTIYIMAGTHYPCSRDVFTGRKYGCPK